MKFLGLGVPELVIILVVILLIFGPKNLPKLGSAIGKTFKNLKDGMDGAKGDDKEDESETMAQTVEAAVTEDEKKEA